MFPVIGQSTPGILQSGLYGQDSGQNETVGHLPGKKIKVKPACPHFFLSCFLSFLLSFFFFCALPPDAADGLCQFSLNESGLKNATALGARVKLEVKPVSLLLRVHGQGMPAGVGPSLPLTGLTHLQAAACTYSKFRGLSCVSTSGR